MKTHTMPGWMITTTGVYHYWVWGATKKEAIRLHLRSWNTCPTWKQCYRHGDRAVRATVSWEEPDAWSSENT